MNTETPRRLRRASIMAMFVTAKIGEDWGADGSA
jgi:hypothetical protein